MKALILSLLLLFSSTSPLMASTFIEYATMNPGISFISIAYAAHSIVPNTYDTEWKHVAGHIEGKVGSDFITSTAQVVPSLSAAQNLGTQIQATQAAYINDYPGDVYALSLTYFTPTEDLGTSVFGYVIYSEFVSGTLWVEPVEIAYTDPLNGAEVLVFTPSVPVPGAVWLLGSGLAGLAALRKKKNKK